MSVSCSVPSRRVIKVHPPLTLFQLNETCFATSTYFTIPARHAFRSRVKLEPTMPHLADLNIRNASYWKPLEKTEKIRPVKDVLKKLGSLKSFPLSRLVSELNQIRENPMGEGQDETWYLYILWAFGLIMIVIIVLFVLVKKKGILAKKKPEGIHVGIIKPGSLIKGDDPIKLGVI